jgi:hypothetical protein
MHMLVCHERVPLERAEQDIASDWIAAYERYVGPNLSRPAPQTGLKRPRQPHRSEPR